MTEKSAQEKLAELDQRDSNAETVENIATTGHVASVGITVVSMVGATAKVGLAAAAAKTCAAGIAKAVAGFGGPLVAGMAGGMLGGWLASKRVTGLWIPGVKITQFLAPQIYRRVWDIILFITIPFWAQLVG